ncbi:hypothetical protein BJ875DRAFT_444987 [Amylocarpus encephaloides]|uniref:Myosin motor domain-containing protein n=1 Tax=Amylocarpus encephaloides TaxID=45428 RepID=A0A9P8C1M6_9HELO|nr:hypothetical protein BJ875DRAFT_444987 [Amylocarpus encephaloides]
MPPLNLELDLELNSDVDKVFSYLVLLAAVQEIPQPKPLPTPVSTPSVEPDTDGQTDQPKKNLVDPHDHSSPVVKQRRSQGGQPLYTAYVEDADDSSVERTSDNFQHLANLSVWPPSDHNDNTNVQDVRQGKEPCELIVTSPIPQLLDTPQHTPSKRKQHFEDGSAFKRAHIEPVDAIEGGLERRNTGHLVRWTYEEFALSYYMLVHSSLRTSDIRDMANNILTRALGASRSEGLDKYQLGVTEIFVRADMLEFLENLRTARLNHYAIVIQKNLKTKYYRRKIKAAITIQKVWRVQNQPKISNALHQSAILVQAAAKGFLRRKEIKDNRFRKAAIVIQRLWCLRRYMKKWRQYRRQVIIVQSLWRGKCARGRCNKTREVEASPNTKGEVDHGAHRMAELPAQWRTQLQRIKSIGVLEDCQRFCYIYMEELEAGRGFPKKRHRPSVKERFIDVLFPHTIKYKSEKGRKRKKGRKVSDTKARELSEQKVREKAEKKFEYYMRLGKPLWRMSQRYGLGILLVLLKEVTETS